MLENLSKVRIKEIELQCAKERIRELEHEVAASAEAFAERDIERHNRIVELEQLLAERRHKLNDMISANDALELQIESMSARKPEPGIHYCGHCGKPCRCEDDPWVRREGDCDCSKEDDRLREENARLRAEKRRPVDVGVGEWDRLRRLLEIPHEHPEGMNECYICDRSLVTDAADQIEKLREELERSKLKWQKWRGNEPPDHVQTIKTDGSTPIVLLKSGTRGLWWAGPIELPEEE
uniref:Uncharacterized protein n=1 Tax=viral metagenome TaxID=1070528 RepID=A0A6M3K463_9ZZZZ